MTAGLIYGEGLKLNIMSINDTKLVYPPANEVLVGWDGRVIDQDKAQPGFKAADLSKKIGVPIQAINRLIRRGQLNHSWRTKASGRFGAYITPFDDLLIERLEIRDKVIKRSPRYAKSYGVSKDGLNKTSRLKSRHRTNIDTGVREKYCYACEMERGLPESQAWHPEDAAWWDKQKPFKEGGGSNYYSICKLCRAERRLRAIESKKRDKANKAKASEQAGEVCLAK